MAASRFRRESIEALEKAMSADTVATSCDLPKYTAITLIRQAGEIVS